MGFTEFHAPVPLSEKYPGQKAQSLLRMLVACIGFMIDQSTIKGQLYFQWQFLYEYSLYDGIPSQISLKSFIWGPKVSMLPYCLPPRGTDNCELMKYEC